MASGTAPLAERLRERKGTILALWEQRARASLPAASHCDRLMLLDGMPDLVEEIASTLADQPRAVPGQQGSEIASGHGRQRASATDFSLEQVIAEYELFRQALFEVLERDDSLRRDQRERLFAEVQVRVREAAKEFAAVRDAERERARLALEDANAELDRKVRERTTELARSEARFRGLVEGVKDYAIFTVDPHGVVTSWNAGAERMKGYTAEEILGSHFEVLYPEEGRLRDEPMAHLRAAALEGRFRGEGMRRRKHGDLFLADVLITPMYDGDALAGFSKVVQDLTERNTLMQEFDLLRSDADRLRVEAEYRTRFVATLSHDLRSPLSAAKSGAHLIARAPERPEKVRQWALRISDAVDRADRMIVDLLDASRLDAGQRFSFELARCDLMQTASDVCAELATRFGDRFVLEHEGETEGFWNADALWRVLENLLMNAVKYGEPGSPITLRLRRKDNRMWITVHNRGTIIPVADQAKLFQPFHRTHLAEESGKQGWGLGLTLVRGIVEAHKGEVKVESYPTDGTTFTVDLPVDPRS